MRHSHAYEYPELENRLEGLDPFPTQGLTRLLALVKKGLCGSERGLPTNQQL
jgi:hypothetical protein